MGSREAGIEEEGGDGVWGCWGCGSSELGQLQEGTGLEQGTEWAGSSSKSIPRHPDPAQPAQIPPGVRRRWEVRIPVQVGLKCLFLGFSVLWCPAQFFPTPRGWEQFLEQLSFPPLLLGTPQ